MGPLAAMAKVLPLWITMWRHALKLRSHPPDVVVLVYFGVFNLRLAKTLRLLRCRAPIVYYFPPGAWFDRYKQAHAVAQYTRPLTVFRHQRDYYRWLGLDIAFFGHPLVSMIAPRAPGERPAPEGGCVALLPGSRRDEIRRHLAPLLDAFALLRSRRPALRGVIGAAHSDAEAFIGQTLRDRKHDGALVTVRGSAAALESADAAWIASGTAVLEAALREVPTVALYVVAPAEVELGRRIWHGPYITLPNMLLGRELVPELLQDDANPERLAAELEALLKDPSSQVAGMREIRALLGPPDALQRCAQYVIDVAYERTAER
jgi:lipid-A-disaccharide synthase